MDGGLFAVEAKTGELSFKEAPDYENPGDVESTDPESGAGDNEYIVVIAVASGEGERERTGEQAIRVWVTDVEMEEAMEDEMEETESLFVPVILSSAGRNRSFFTSELTLTNRGEEEVELDYTYTATDEPETRSGQASGRRARGQAEDRDRRPRLSEGSWGPDSGNGQPGGDASGGGAAGIRGASGGADHDDST